MFVDMGYIVGVVNTRAHLQPSVTYFNTAEHYLTKMSISCFDSIQQLNAS